MAKTFTTNTPDGIEWYCEQQGSGPNLILIPSGEGDCSSFAKIASMLAQSFTVTTFDMPGFSRSTAPGSAFEGDDLGRLLAKQVTGLLDALHIEAAHVYGCSSGGLCALGLVADHPTRVLSATVHEVPIGDLDAVDSLVKLDDDAIPGACHHLVGQFMCLDPKAWDALGPEYHARLAKNYVTWVRKYVGGGRNAKPLTDKEYKQRPITWTIGGKSPAEAFFTNVPIAVRNGIDISLLPCKHLPQVDIPDKLAEHIKTSVDKMSI